MSGISRVTLVLLVSASFANYGWGQRGVPMPRPVPTPRPVPVHPVVVPHSGSQGGSGSSTFDPVIFIAGAVAVVVCVVGLIFGVRAWKNRTVAHLRILRMPPGEAPEATRRAWVGV